MANGPETGARPIDLQGARVDALMAVVREMASSLHRVSAQLELELAGARGQDGGANGVDGLALATLRDENAHLREALEHRAVIEQAKGILMARHRCDAEAAFGMLTEISRRDRRKVRHIAAALVGAAAAGAAAAAIDVRDGSEERVGQR